MRHRSLQTNRRSNRRMSRCTRARHEEIETGTGTPLAGAHDAGFRVPGGELLTDTVHRTGGHGRAPRFECDDPYRPFEDMTQSHQHVVTQVVGFVKQLVDCIQSIAVHVTAPSPQHCSQSNRAQPGSTGASPRPTNRTCHKQPPTGRHSKKLRQQRSKYRRSYSLERATWRSASFQKATNGTHQGGTPGAP